MSTPWIADEHLKPVKKTHSSWKILGVLVLLLIAGAGIFVYVFFRSPAEATVAVDFGTLPQPLIGEPFSLTLSFSNQSDKVVYGTKLSIILPEDMFFVGEFSGQRVYDEVLGTLGPGSIMQRTVNVVVLGEPQSVKRVRADLKYSTTPEGKVQFDSKTNADVRVGDPAFQLLLDTPSQVLNGVPFTMTLKYKNMSTETFKNVQLSVRYPDFFQFKQASVDPASRTNDSWSLGSLEGNAEGTILVQGIVIGPEGSFFTLNAGMTVDYLGQSQKIATQTASLAIATSPLSVSVAVNNRQDYIARVGDLLRYTITYKNNSSTVFRGLTVSAKLVGTMFDYSTLRFDDGAFNSLTNTLTWITASAPQLISLNPGAEGSVDFDISLKKGFSISRVSDKNYTVRVEATVQSQTVSPNTAADQTISVGNLEVKVGGAIALQAKALWRDAAWGIVNSGPYPPRVNQPTQYAIHWLITNYATDASNVRVEAYLQSGARFIGNAKSTGTTLPQYDALTGKVTWDIPSIAATRGIVGAPVEGVFQIEAMPSIIQLGSSVPLLSDSRLQARDMFTGEVLQDNAQTLTTDLPEDPTISVQDRRVQQ